MLSSISWINKISAEKLFIISNCNDIIQYVLYGCSLQRSLSKEDDIKRKYEAQLQKACTENAALMEKLESTLQERNIAAEELNEMVKERNAFALQAQQEFERAER